MSEQDEQGWAEVAGHNIPDMYHPKVTVADVTFDHPVRVGQSKKRDELAKVLRDACFDFDGGGAGSAVDFRDHDVNGHVLADAALAWFKANGSGVAR